MNRPFCRLDQRLCGERSMGRNTQDGLACSSSSWAKRGLAYSRTRLSKVVSQPLELPMLTVVHVAVQLVTSVTYWLGFTVICTLGWPSQAALTVLETDPPLKAVSRTNRLGVTKVIESLVRPGPLNLTLLVVLAPRGAE